MLHQCFRRRRKRDLRGAFRLHRNYNSVEGRYPVAKNLIVVLSLPASPYRQEHLAGMGYGANCQPFALFRLHISSQEPSAIRKLYAATTFPSSLLRFRTGCHRRISERITFAIRLPTISPYMATCRPPSPPRTIVPSRKIGREGRFCLVSRVSEHVRFCSSYGVPAGENFLDPISGQILAAPDYLPAITAIEEGYNVVEECGCPFIQRRLQQRNLFCGNNR